MIIKNPIYNVLVKNKLLTDTTAEDEHVLYPYVFHTADGPAAVGKIRTYNGNTTIVPSDGAQTLETDKKYVNGDIVVAPIPSQYKDMSEADAVAGDIVAGKKAGTSVGVVTGTLPIYDGETTVTENKTLLTAGKKLTQNITVNVPVPVIVEPKDVNLYDYDGTLLHSYTAAQFLALSSLPAVPTHANTANGKWNWSLADAKDQVTAYGEIDIGAVYTADTPETKVMVHLDKGTGLTVTISGSNVYDWGDGTSSASPHTYSDYGDYWIKGSFSASEYPTTSLGFHIAKVYLEGYSNTTNKGLGQNGSSNLEIICLGNGTSIAQNAFSNCFNAKAIIVPSGCTMMTTYATRSIYSAKVVSLPKSMTYIQAGVFSSALLKRIVLPNGVQMLQQQCMNYARSIREIKIPATVTSINIQVFDGNINLSLVRLYSATPPSLSSSSAFPAWTRFEIPAGSLSRYESTSNWLSYAGRYIERSV